MICEKFGSKTDVVFPVFVDMFGCIFAGSPKVMERN